MAKKISQTHKKTSPDNPRMVKNRAVMIDRILDRRYKDLYNLEKQAREADLWDLDELINETAVEVEKLHLWREISRRRAIIYGLMNTIREQYPDQWMKYHGVGKYA